MIESTKAKFSRTLFLLISFALFCCLIACGGSKDEGAGSNTTTTVTAAYIDLVASPPTVKSDNSTTSTITITALNSSHAALSGVTVSLSTDYGNLAGGTSGTVTTGTDGTATLTFSSGGSVANGYMNRTATITATSGSAVSQIPIEIIGSTVTLASTGTTLTTSGTDSITLTVTAKNAGDNGVNGATVTLTQSSTDGGLVNFGSSTGTTSTISSTAGVFKTTITGSSAGTVTITARALGASTSTAVTVATAVETFAIDQQTLCNPVCTVVSGNPDPTSMVDGNTLAIRVNVPSAYSSSNIIFATGCGSWAESGNSVAIKSPPHVGNKATATLQASAVCTAGIQTQIQGYSSIQDTLTVYMLSANPAASIILQATPTVVSMKTSTTTGTSTVTATVRDASSPTPFLVANVPVAFSIVNPTGGGETISPVIVMTGTDGTASTTFTSGTQPAYDAGGVKIHASVVGTSVQTGVLPSGSDASVVIGGKGGSIAFGMATSLSTSDGATQYVQAMSVLVADINGNPVPNAVVSLSLWPIAWSTGVGCSPDPDGQRCVIGPPISCASGNYGTYLNEDVNENVILDPGEDGYRMYFYGTLPAAVTPGTLNGSLTPGNSWGGAVPPTVKTGSNGVASFDLTYPKNSALWTVVRVRASTIVQGSETVAQTIFRLSALASDVSPCLLGASPYTY